MKKLLLLVVLTLFPLLPVYAVVVDDLYQADIPVTSQLSDDRISAVREGFSRLMIKLTGDPNIAKNPVIKDAIQRADYYVQTFSYSAPTTASATYSLHVSFEADDIKRMLRKAGVAYWDENRPLIVVWLAITNPKHEVAIIDDQTPGDILDALRQQGEKFALPLIFPLMDVADLGEISPEDINNMSVPVVKKASQRYSPNAYLIGKIESVDGACQSHWLLIVNNKQWNWTIADKTPEDIVAEVLYQVSQTLQAR